MLALNAYLQSDQLSLILSLDDSICMCTPLSYELPTEFNANQEARGWYNLWES